MTSKISTQEWELLSAYLDNQLTPSERLSLETKLHSSESLQTALEEMRRIRILLRSQPRLRAPRNFRLTAQMVGQRTTARRWASPAFGLASAFASLLLVVIIASDLLQSRAPLAAVQYNQARPMEKALPPQALQSAGSASEPAPESQVLAPQAMAPSAAGSATLAEGTPAAAAPLLAQPANKITQEPAADSQSNTYPQTTTVESAAPAAANPIEPGTLTQIPSPPAAIEQFPTTEAAVTPIPLSPPSLPAVPYPPHWTLELALALFALIAGVIAWVFHRNR
jgi:hypothetical protein